VARDSRARSGAGGPRGARVNQSRAEVDRRAAACLAHLTAGSSAQDG
jgi:hypothetical protein